MSGGADAGHGERLRGAQPGAGSADPPRSRALIALAIWWCWATVVASVLLFAVYPRLHSLWGLTGAQVAGYTVLVLPVAILRPRLQEPLGRRRPWVSIGAGVMVLAVVAGVVAVQQHAGLAQLLVRTLATGIGEEIIFRGVLWTILLRLRMGVAALVAANVALFAAWHIPSVISGNSSWAGLAIIALLGVVFSLARVVSGRLELPILLHVAANLAGS